MKHTDIVDLLERSADYLGKQVTVCGWVRSARDSGSIAFMDLNDGTTFAKLQIVLDKNVVSVDSECMRNGCSVKIEGELVKSNNPKNATGLELNAKSVVLLGASPADYPLQKKGQTMEYMRTMPHLRLRTNTFNAVFRVRSVAAKAVHDFFQSRHFVYIHTPLITGSDCEGAGEMFQVTTVGFNPKYQTKEEYYAHDFFKRRAGLSVSGQLEGEMAATAMGKIYTFGPSFRAENSNTPRHLAEFWHVEPEVAFAELEDIIETAKDLIQYLIRTVMEECPAEIDFFNSFVEKGLKSKLQHVLDSEFAVLTYTDAIRLLQESGASFKYPVEWGCDLQTEHERYLTEKLLKKPVFVTNYPKEIKSFYMKQNDDGKTVAATDLLVPGVGEIIGGSEREVDYGKLTAAMQARGMNLDDYSDYLDLRKFGTVPHSGFGLGFERFVMYVTGMTNIRDVILFPRTVGSIR